MKIIGFSFIQFLILMMLQACQQQDNWTTLTFHEDPPKPNFPSYSLQYPSTWVGMSERNHITLASEESLLKDVPGQLDTGQIVVNVNVNINTSLEDMIKAYASTLQSNAEFDNPVSYELNDRPAAYQEGAYAESGDQIFIIAVDMGENMRALLTSRMAAGELNDWRRTLMRVAESFRVNP